MFSLSICENKESLKESIKKGKNILTINFNEDISDIDFSNVYDIKFGAEFNQDLRLLNLENVKKMYIGLSYSINLRGALPEGLEILRINSIYNILEGVELNKKLRELDVLNNYNYSLESVKINSNLKLLSVSNYYNKSMINLKFPECMILKLYDNNSLVDNLPECLKKLEITCLKKELRNLPLGLKRLVIYSDMYNYLSSSIIPLGCEVKIMDKRY